MVNDKPRRYVDEVISKILAQDVGYVCTIGKQCEQVHDMFDEEVAYREAEIENLYLPDHDIMTTWHHEFEEGIWFAIYAAYDDEIDIKEVVILDMTDGIEIPRIEAYIKGLKDEAEEI